MNSLLALPTDLFKAAFAKHAERKRLSEQFEALRSEVHSTVNVSELPVVLRELRRFFMCNGLDRKEGFEDFFYRWLAGWIVESGKPTLVPGRYSPGERAWMERELDALVLYPGIMQRFQPPAMRSVRSGRSAPRKPMSAIGGF